jgi:acetyltransferase-like isoleucine patch superfamily enzyme
VRHPTALVETDAVGPGTRIWAFVHVMPGATIGSDCNIGDHCFIEGGTRIGNGVVLKNGVSLWTGVTIEDGAFIGPNVAFTNVFAPRARIFPKHWETTQVMEGASIGANATIVCGARLGRFCLVGAGSVVTRDVPDFGIVYGNPARLKGWACRCGQRLPPPDDGGRLTCVGCSRAYRLSANQVTDE